MISFSLRCRIALLALIMTISTCSGPDSSIPTSPTPSGRVATVQLTVTADKGAVKGPVAGAVVSIDKVNMSAPTNDDGIAKLDNVPFAEYTTSVTAFGFAKYTGQIRVDASSVENAVKLAPTNVVELASVVTDEYGPVPAGTDAPYPATYHLRARYNSLYEGSDLLVGFSVVQVLGNRGAVETGGAIGKFLLSQDVAPGVREVVYKVDRQPYSTPDSAGFFVAMGPNAQPSLADANPAYPLHWVRR